MTKPQTAEESARDNDLPRMRDIDALIEKLSQRLDRGGDAPIPPGWLEDSKGRLVRESMVPDAALLEDQTVRIIVAYGLDLADQIARFRAHSFDDLAAQQDVVAEKYGVRKKGGRKGNRTFTSFDGRLKVTIQVQDQIQFGPELQAARDLVNECIADWSSAAREEIQALMQHAFQPDKEGMVNREAVFSLRRLDIDDPRWQRARQAITDSIRVVGSKTYMRIYMRPTPEQSWKAIPIDIAAEWQPS